MNTWGVRSTRELFTYIQTTMPPGTAGKLDQQTYLEITAFILEANGAVAGSQPMSSTTDLAIRSIASGEVPALVRTATASGDFIAPRPGTTLRGLTVSGEVKNYVPVTDEMLLHPDPGDWLMIRRNYQAWSYSPLTQITNKNVQDLQLAWVWGVRDINGKRRRPSFLEHFAVRI